MRGSDSESFGYTLLEPRAVGIIEPSSTYSPAASFPGQQPPQTTLPNLALHPNPQRATVVLGLFTLLPLGEDGLSGLSTTLPPGFSLPKLGARKPPRDLA